MSEGHEDEIVHRQLRTDREDPAAAVAEVVAELDGRRADELTATYRCIDGVLGNLFSEPPSPDAQMEVTFTYEGYRVTVEQDGAAKFVKVD
ncbi:HalOD1 output domain-containing protein [Halobium palmae]|uniref:HalOD1 output domain-containing protein n=1 Tax=Halobium palmae TaxID=1776492 RepID=A0ABD5S214_9EURY